MVSNAYLTTVDLIENVTFEGPVIETIRILAVANAFVGMVSARAYQRAVPFRKVADILMEQSKTKYDGHRLDQLPGKPRRDAPLGPLPRRPHGRGRGGVSITSSLGRHPRAGGGPWRMRSRVRTWISAFAGMTVKARMTEKVTVLIKPSPRRAQRTYSECTHDRFRSRTHTRKRSLKLPLTISKPLIMGRFEKDRV